MLDFLELTDQLLKSKQFEKALKLCRKYLKDPKYALHAHKISAYVLIQLNRNKEAKKILYKAIQKWPNDLSIRQDYARLLYLEGECQAALKQYEKILLIKPDDSIFLSNKASCLLALNDLKEAKIWALKSTLVKKPHVNGFNTLGIVCTKLRDVDEAEKAFRTALEIGPVDVHQVYNYLNFCESHNKPERGVDTYLSLPKHFQEHPLILSKYAFFQKRAKNYDDAKASLKHALSHPHIFTPQQFRDAQSELGQILNLQQKYDEAFTCFEQANNSAQESYKNLAHESPYAEIAFQDEAKLDGESQIGEQPIFVLGFPRSSTTLMEQILSTDDSVSAFEETPVITEVFRKMRQNMENNCHLKRSDYQALFFKIYREKYNWEQKKILLDRSAPNSIYVQFIRDLFPTAKIIFLHRHPMDLVLSCFMQNFMPNYITIEFTNLNNTTSLFCDTYCALNNISKQPETYLDLKYEDLINNFEHETKKIFKFIGLKWNERVYDYWKFAKQKERIHTASYQQVIGPIYASSINRWHNYKPYLSDVKDRLQPYCQQLGYKL
ncbi:MAG: sulfotransferase [Methylocystaceae bacterium]|nr:sulfotransferase [Methylocystaceae bacterium]